MQSWKRHGRTLNALLNEKANEMDEHCYDSIYMTFCNRENYRHKEIGSSGVQVKEHANDNRIKRISR